MCGSRHSTMWEPRAAEPQPQPQPQGDEGVAPPSRQPPEDVTVPGVLGASPRPRISLCAVMRSISQLETPEPPELPGEPLSAEVSAGTGRNRGAGSEGAALPEPPVTSP